MEGDCNGDGQVDFTDPIFLMNALFSGGKNPSCRPRCDFQMDGVLNITDLVLYVQYLWIGFPIPKPLVIPPERCGDGLDNDCDGEVDEDCSIHLSWSRVTRDITGRPEKLAFYRIYYRVQIPGRDDLADYRLIGAVGAEFNTAVIQDKEIQSGVVYEFAVTAVDLAGNESAFSIPLPVSL
jgi:hypothetical protein